jgi:hypothetical protein
MNKEMKIGMSLAIVFGVFILGGMLSTDTKPVATEVLAEEPMQAIEVEPRGWIEGLDDIKVYNNDLKEEVEVRFCSNVDGVWEVGTKIKETTEIPRTSFKEGESIMAREIHIEDMELIKIPTNSSYILGVGNYIARFENGEEIHFVVESEEDAKKRILKEAYAIAYYESYEENDGKSCAYVVDRTREICAIYGVEVYALLLNNHVIPVVYDGFGYYGYQPHTLDAFGSFNREYVHEKILASWEFKRYQSNGMSKVVNSEVLETTDNIWIDIFYLDGVVSDGVLKEKYKGYIYGLGEIKHPKIRELVK